MIEKYVGNDVNRGRKVFSFKLYYGELRNKKGYCNFIEQI